MFGSGNFGGSGFGGSSFGGAGSNFGSSSFFDPGSFSSNGPNLFGSERASGQFSLFGQDYSMPRLDYTSTSSSSAWTAPILPSKQIISFPESVTNGALDTTHWQVHNRGLPVDGNRNARHNPGGLFPTIGGRYDDKNGLRGEVGVQRGDLGISRSFKSNKSNWAKAVGVFAAVLLGSAGEKWWSGDPEDNERRERIREERLEAEWPSGMHVAVVGTAGSGKSSLVNALQGVRNGAPGAAAVGTTETTHEVERYLRQGTQDFYIHDVPGAETLSVPTRAYFHRYKLHLYDCILVVYSDRLGPVDLGMRAIGTDYRLSVHLVRSKSDQLINDIIDNNADGDDLTATEARQRHITTTRNEVEQVFEASDVPTDQRSFPLIVNWKRLYRLVSGGAAHQHDIDETELLTKLNRVRSIG